MTCKSFLVVTIAALAAWAIACRANLKAGDGVPLFGGSELTLEIDPPSVSIPATPTNPPPGTCIKFTYLGANKEVLGEAEIIVGGPNADAPTGTEEIVTGPCGPSADSDDDDKLKSDSMQGSESLVGGTPVAIQRFSYRLMPFRLEDGIGTYASYRILARSYAKAELANRAFVRGMLDQPPPAHVLPDSVVRVALAASGDVVVEMFTTQAPQSLSFQWNDDPSLALEQASVSASNGWYVTTVSIPADRVDYSVLGATNRLEYEISLGERSVGTSLELTVEP